MEARNKQIINKTRNVCPPHRFIPYEPRKKDTQWHFLNKQIHVHIVFNTLTLIKQKKGLIYLRHFRQRGKIEFQDRNVNTYFQCTRITCIIFHTVWCGTSGPLPKSTSPFVIEFEWYNVLYHGPPVLVYNKLIVVFWATLFNEKIYIYIYIFKLSWTLFFLQHWLTDSKIWIQTWLY